MRRPWEISRRALLRGSSAAIGLPLLEAMAPDLARARAAGASSPRYLLFYAFPGGTPDTSQRTTGAGGTGPGEGRPGTFWPKTPGSTFEMTPILQPLSDLGLRDDILPISNLSNGIGEVGTGPHAGGDHPRSQAALFTGVDPSYAGEPNRSAGISVDQRAASALGQFTPALPSLLVGVSHGDYVSLASWSGPTSLNSPLLRPSDAFRKVFENCSVDPKAYAKRLAYRQSVLHSAKQDIDRISRKLGKADLDTLDKYLTGVGDLEKRIAALGNVSNSGGKCTANGFVAGDGGSIPQRLQQMLDIVGFAFQADRTRVALVHVVLQVAPFDWLGPPNSDFPNWHDDIEHGASAEMFGYLDGPQRAEAYVRGCAWMVGQFGYLMRKLKDMPAVDGSSSLLRNTIGVCTSELCYGNGHNMRHVPVIVAGQGGGAVQTGRYIRVAGGGDRDERPIADLWLSMLNAVGVGDTKFGNSTGPLSLA